MNYFRQIDRYLDGVMGPDEKERFENEIKKNDALRAEIELQKKIARAIGDKEILSLESQLDKIYHENYRSVSRLIRVTPRTKKIVAYISGVAAAILIISIISAILLKKSTSAAELYAEYYQPAAFNMSFRTAENVVDNDLRSAMILYEKKEYDKAIELFENILEGDESRIGLNLYSGISHMEINEYAEANVNFKKIIDHKANAFFESAEWYLGLCYLMTDEKEKAEEIFVEIAGKDGYYKKEAKRILKMLK